MNTSSTQTPSSSITQNEFNLIGECLQSTLEYYANQLFTSGQHYLVDVHEGPEARRAWAGETIDQSSGGADEPVRLVYRMMSGVIQKQQKISRT